jgi:anaerobic selenocysteine-containing dehydrogenase
MIGRRKFLKAAAGAAGMGAAMVSGAAAAGAGAAGTAARPNILFALADDWGFGHAGAYGCGWVKTPGLTAEPERLERNSPGQRPGGM